MASIWKIIAGAAAFSAAFGVVGLSAPAPSASAQSGDIAFINFPNQTNPSTPCGMSGNITSATNPAGGGEAVQGCVFSSSGSNVTDQVAWTFTVTPQDAGGTATDEVCLNQTESGSPLEGVSVDADNNNCVEAVGGGAGSSAANTPGVAQQGLEFHTAQQYTITFCLDSNSNGVCDQGEPSAAGTKTVTVTTEAHDHLRFALDVTGPTDLCHTEITQRTFLYDQNVQLVDCAFDQSHNPFPGATVTWFVDSGPGSVTPTQATTDVDGKARTTLSGGQVGQQTLVHACKDLDGDGYNDSCSNQLIVNWTTCVALDCHSARSYLSIARNRIAKTQRFRIFGELTTDAPDICNVGGKTIKLFRSKTRGGGGKLIVRATTSRSGAFKFKVRRPRWTRFYHTEFGGTASCLPSRSRDVKIRGRLS